METEGHYLVHKNQPLVSVLSQMHPFNTSPAHFPKIHSNIIFPSTTSRSGYETNSNSTQ